MDGRGVHRMDNMERVKEHFEGEAEQYDAIIRKLIPYYSRMVEAVVNTLPFDNSAEITVLDLGCGTGTVARAVKDRFPGARLACLDIAENMLHIARGKLANAPETAYICCDFNQFAFDRQYDAVVSSLALHHLATDADKLSFYKKIYAGLKNGGVLVNADVVLASTDILQRRYMEQWKQFMLESVPLDEVEGKWIPNYHAEDRPVSLLQHFDMLHQAGFDTMDVVWKYYNFAVYMAVKKES